jgi:hypothetical protein
MLLAESSFEHTMYFMFLLRAFLLAALVATVINAAPNPLYKRGMPLLTATLLTPW